MISLPHTPTNYEISAWSILLKFLISTHACLFIHTASYTIIRSILSGTYMNVPPYTLVRAYTDTEFYTFATLYHYSTPHFYLELWRNVKQYVQQNVPTKLNLNAICLIKKTFSLQLDYKVYKTKTKLDSISICIEKKISALSVLQLDTLSRYD